MTGVVSCPSYIQYCIDSISIFSILVFKILSIVSFSNSWYCPPLPVWHLILYATLAMLYNYAVLSVPGVHNVHVRRCGGVLIDIIRVPLGPNT